MNDLFYFFAALVGLALGSFYSVCVLRTIEEKSIVRPRSHCPACGRTLTWWELLPVVSWLLLRGRCAGCKARISVLYPLLELASGVWAVLAARHFGPTPWFLGALTLGGLYLIASFIDFKVYLLPDIYTYPAAVLGLVMGSFSPVVGPAGAFIGAAAGYGLFRLLAMAYKALRGVEGLGGGDAKLMLSIGGVVGWMGLPYAVLVGSAAALLASPIYLVGQGKGRDMPIPFGPFLCFGAMVQMLYGDVITGLLAGR